MKDITRKGLKNLCPPLRIHVLSPGQITFILLRCTWLGIDRPKPSKTDQRPLFQGIESASERSREQETLIMSTIIRDTSLRNAHARCRCPTEDSTPHPGARCRPPDKAPIVL
jgi:hypothetical protein